MCSEVGLSSSGPSLMLEDLHTPSRWLSGTFLKEGQVVFIAICFSESFHKERLGDSGHLTSGVLSSSTLQ